ncbi:unnamed protein product [Trichobilharzia regenti]|nr:unnamed protein product [Trichobilharzia regenti]
MINIKPEIGIVCGSGLGELANGVQNATVIPYVDIPGFPNSTAIPIRVMKLLGVKTLLLSNAVGGLNRDLKGGDFVVLKDHLYFAGLGLNGILVGENEDKKLAIKIAREEKFGDVVHEGVYGMNGGPCYETPAECKMMLMMGCDVVGK